MVEPVALDPLYYQSNFERLCDTAWSQYEDLLDEDERGFYRSYRGANQAARCLYIRLISRRGPLFRAEQLHYQELGDIGAAIAAAIHAGLLQQVETPEPELLLALLRKQELLEIYPGPLAGAGAMRKADIIERLLAELDGEALVQAWRDWRKADMFLLEPCHRACVELLQLLFFGNGRQSLTDFVLSDLGVMRYFDYPLDRRQRLFESRGQVDDYLFLSQLRERYQEALEAGDREAMLGLAEPLLEAGSVPLLEQRRDRLRNRIARQLEREQAFAAALRLYQSCTRHPARERRVRVLQRLQRSDEALELCELMQAQPWCEAELDFVRRQIPALRKKLGRSYRRVSAEAFAQDELVLAAGRSVELAAAEHYAASWEQVYYVENTLVNAAFGLALWEQIFMPVGGAFVNPFQAAPLDMFSRDFYQRRRAEVDRRLDELAGGDFADEILAAFDRWHQIANRWVNWRYLSRELLQRALQHIPVEHWLAMWSRILFDPEANRSGFPDLIAMDSSQGYCLIEVKGPGDQLQPNQRRWLRFFSERGIPARVARVEWLDA